MGVEAPIPISVKLGDFNSLFRKIVTAAEHPHLSIPETEAGRSRKQYHRLINRSLMAVSGMSFFHYTCIYSVYYYFPLFLSFFSFFIRAVQFRVIVISCSVDCCLEFRDYLANESSKSNCSNWVNKWELPKPYISSLPSEPLYVLVILVSLSIV